MKVAPELLKLAREHHNTLVLANKAINTANKGKPNEILALCLSITNNFKKDYHNHFKIEEQAIFSQISAKSKAMKIICSQLIQEHQELLQLADSLKNQPENLVLFGKLLKSHTRVEDRELFPHIDLLTQNELKFLDKLANGCVI